MSTPMCIIVLGLLSCGFGFFEKKTPQEYYRRPAFSCQ
jgi:hypothetical protein